MAGFRENHDLFGCGTDWNRESQQVPLSRRFGASYPDAAFELCTILDADSRRRNIANQPAIFLDLAAVARVEIAGGLAVDDYFAWGNFRTQLCRAP